MLKGILEWCMLAVLTVNGFTGCALLETAVPGAMSDSQVIGVLTTIDQGEMAGARLAQEKASFPAVREYAQRLLQEHAALQFRRQQAVAQLSIHTQKPALASKLEGANEKLLNDLSTKSGWDFDWAYINAQIAKHDAALSLARETANSPRSSPVAEQVREAAPELEAHYARARSIRQQLLFARQE